MRRLEHLLGDDDLAEVRVGRRAEAATVARSGHGRRSYRTPVGPVRARHQPRGGRRPLDPPAAADVGGRRLAPRHGQDPLDRGGVGRVALDVVGPRARPAPRPWPPPRAPARSVRASVGSSDRGLGAAGGRRRRRPGRPGGRAAGTTSRSATSASSGQHLVADPVADGRPGRRFDGSTTGSRPAAAHSASVSARRRARIGWRRPGAHAGEPVEAGPPQQVEQHGLGLVVGGVAEQRRRGRGPRGGRRGPGPRGWARARPRRRSARNVAPKRSAAAADDVGLGRRAGPQAVVDVHGGDVAARRRRPAPAGRASRRRPTRRTRAACPAPGTRSGRAASATGSRPPATAAASAGSGTRRPSARSSGAGSRISIDGRQVARAPPRPGRAASVPPARSTVGDEALALLVLVELGLEADELLQQLGEPVGGVCGAARSTRPKRSALGTRSCAGAVHGDVAVALEQAHHARRPGRAPPAARAWRAGSPGRRRRAGSGPPARRRPCGSRRRGGAWGRGRPRRGSVRPARGSAPAATARR